MLSSLLFGLTSTAVNSSGLYYVRPTAPARATCPGQPCFTLDEYAENKTEYFVSDIRMVFLSGEHKLSRVIEVANVTNVTFVGYNSTPTQPDAHIVCNGSDSSLTFTSVTFLTINGLKFSGCGASEIASIVLNRVFDFQLVHVSISGDGYDLNVISPFGNSIILDSEFHSSPVMVTSPPDDSILQNMLSLVIRNTLFLSSGFDITAKYCNFQLNLSLSHVTMLQGGISVSCLYERIGSIVLDLDSVSMHEGSIELFDNRELRLQRTDLSVVVQICNSTISNSSNPGIRVQGGVTSVYINNSDIIGPGDKNTLYITSVSDSSCTIENSVVSIGGSVRLYSLGAQSISIRNSTVSNSTWTGIDISGQGNMSVDVYNSEISGHKMYGVQMDSSHLAQPDFFVRSLTIEDSIMSNNQQGSIYLDSYVFTNGPSIQFVQICNSTIRNSNSGVKVRGRTNTSVYINNSEIVGHQRSAIALNPDFYSSVIIENSVVSIVGEKYLSGGSIDLNINYGGGGHQLIRICSSTINSSSGWYGIQVRGMTNTSVYILNSEITGFSAGVHISTSSGMRWNEEQPDTYALLTIENSVVSNEGSTGLFSSGISVSAATFQSVLQLIVIMISNSSIINSTDTGVQAEGGWNTTARVHIHNSEITGHRRYCIRITHRQPDTYSELTIENSVVSNTWNSGTGIYVTGPTSFYINNTQIVGHTNGGMYFDYPGPTYSNTIQNSAVSGNVLMSRDSLSGAALTLQGGASVLLRNVSFVENAVFTDLTIPTAVVTLASTKNVTFVNCIFSSNIGTPILAYNSNFTVEGTNTFVNNSGYQGGAMAFYENSQMYLQNHTHITFKNNRAQRVGGAIYVYSNPIDHFEISVKCDGDPNPKKCRCDDNVNLKSKCFLYFNMSVSSRILENLDIRLNFIDNTAENGGGSSLYGERINICHVTNGYPYSNLVGYQFFADSRFISLEPNATTDLSYITSDPSRVCLCTDEMIPDCLLVFPSKTVYPGETFFIPAVVVGQNFGTVDGSVYSQFIPIGGNRSSPRLGDMQQFQGTHQQRCTKLHYSIKTENSEEFLVLTSSSILISQLPDSDKIECLQESIETYSQPGKFHGKIKDALLSTPVYINVTLLPCPLGFVMSRDPAQCVCDKRLHACNINNQMVHRNQSTWINASFIGNVSSGVITNDKCPFDYCNSSVLDVDLTNPDTQCAFEHSGMLCGGCKPGLSLTLGSSRCRPCPNTYLTLLIPFTVAGLALVFFIKILNLTVAQGMINGLIFYANIVWANGTGFFPAKDQNHLTVFIAWLNLDLGIETCFFDGLNGYSKLWLQFAFPLYIWLVVALVIVLAHYSSTAARIFGNDSVPVLATLVFLSYAKLLRTIIVILRYSTLEYPDGSSKAVWSFDGNVEYFGAMHAPLFAVAIAFLLFLWLPYMGILTFAQWLQKVTNYRAMGWFVKLKPFFDAYLGPLQDKHRYWVGFLLLVRGILFVIFSTCDSSTVNLLTIAATMFTLLTYLAYTGHLYRKNYVTLLENSFIINLGTLAVGTLYVKQSGGSQLALTYTSIGVALAEFIVILVHQIALRGKTSCGQYVMAIVKAKNRADYENLDIEEEEEETKQEIVVRVRPLRLTYGQDGEPVLQEETETNT